MRIFSSDDKKRLFSLLTEIEAVKNRIQNKDRKVKYI